MRLEVENVSVAYQRDNIVRDIDLSLEVGQISSLLGPSGCGKTTLLRAIAGFEPVTSGEIRLRGEPVSRPRRTVPPEQRRIGMVFQDFTLFPHIDVTGNIDFGIRHWDSRERRERIKELLKMVGLGDRGKQYPHQLSGGEQQRVALARALAPRPDIILLDEPFSSMDAELREVLAVEVRDILRQEGMTAIMVTHDQIESFAFADEIGVMQDGRIEQWSSAYDVYHRPASRFVADFIGLGAFVKGRVLDGNRVETELGILTGKVSEQYAPAEDIEILMRPDDVLHNDDSPLSAEVVDRQFRGAEFLYQLRLPSGTRLLCYAASHHDHKIGEKIGIEIDLEHLVVFKSAAAQARAL